MDVEVELGDLRRPIAGWGRLFFRVLPSLLVGQPPGRGEHDHQHSHQHQHQHSHAETLRVARGSCDDPLADLGRVDGCDDPLEDCGLLLSPYIDECERAFSSDGIEKTRDAPVAALP